MKIENVVSGALFDLMGFLTTRDDQIVLSTRDNAVPAIDALRAFAQMRKFSLDDAHVANWRAALDQPDGVLPPLPEPWITNGNFAVGNPSRNHYAEDQMHAHAREAWTMGLDVGMEHAPAAVETELPDLAWLLGAASKEGKAVKLSPIAAGTLYNAMTSGAASAPRQPTPELRVVLRDALASGLTMAYGCSRTWSAWGVGTMSEQDFYPAAECDELLDELCDLAIAALGPFTTPHSEAGSAAPAIAAPVQTAPNHAAEMDLARRIGMLLSTAAKVSPVTAGKLAVDIIKMLPGAGSAT